MGEEGGDALDDVGFWEVAAGEGRVVFGAGWRVRLVALEVEVRFDVCDLEIGSMIAVRGARRPLRILDLRLTSSMTLSQ